MALYKNVLDLKTDTIFKDNTDSTITIDQVFKEIIHMYDDKLLFAVYNILQLMEVEINTEFVKNYLNGLILILEPMNVIIRKWIGEKLVC